MAADRLGNLSNSAAELTELTARNLRWISTARACTEVIQLSSMIVLAHVVGPAAFGGFAIALIVQELATNIPSEGVGSSLVQRKTVHRVHLQAGVGLSLVLAAALGAAVLALSELLVHPLMGAQTAALVRLTTPMFLIGALSAVPMAILRRRLDFRRLALIDIWGTGARAVTAVALALAGLGGAALVLGMLAGGAVAMAMALVAAPAPLPRFRRGAVRDLSAYGGPASLAALCWTGFHNGDYAVIGLRLGAAAAGQYWRAYSLAIEYQKKISVVMVQVAFPVLSRSATRADLHALRRRMSRLLPVLTFPLLTGLTITAPALIPWVFGPNWRPAILPTQILCAGGAATLMIDAAGTAIMATGRSRAVLWFGIAHFIVYIGAAALVAPFGIAAVAIAAAAAHTLFLPVVYYVLFRDEPEAPLRCLWHDLAPATVACAAMAAVSLPVSWLATTAHLTAPLEVSAVALVAVPSYGLTLKVLYSDVWRDLLALLGRLVPSSVLHRAPQPGRWPAAERKDEKERLEPVSSGASPALFGRDSVELDHTHV